MITWIIGSGGLLGSALTRTCPVRYEPGPIPWENPDEAAWVLHQQARAFEGIAGKAPWRVIWAAGSATTSTPRPEALAELTSFEGLLTGLRSALPAGSGTFFLTSSAGGVYAGSGDPPFSTRTQPAPLSPYGELKLAQELRAAELLGGIVPTIVGRISNLYGPGQNLHKLQGVLSRLALSAINQTPINIFVPLDTMRDYLYVDDAAQVITHITSRPSEAPAVTTHVLGTGRSTSIAHLVRMMKEISKRRVPVALGAHPSARAQAADLRLEPSVPLPRLTPLPAGIKAVHDDILTRVQASALTG